MSLAGDEPPAVASPAVARSLPKRLASQNVVLAEKGRSELAMLSTRHPAITSFPGSSGSLAADLA